MAPIRTQCVAVVGGSIGGLTAAVLLRDLGFDVTVYERSRSELEGRGAGIVVHPMTVRYLVERGTDLASISCGSTALRYLDSTGRPVYEEPSSYRFTGWNTLYRALLAELGRGRYRLGQALTGIEPAGGRVQLTFDGSPGIECDLAVCADGYASTARSVLAPAAVPEYSGYVGWRGTFPEAAATATTRAALEEAVTFQVMPNSHIVTYPIPGLEGAVRAGDLLFNYVWYRNVAAGEELRSLLTGIDGRERDSLPPGLVQPRFVAEMREATGELGMAPPLREVVTRTEDPFIQKILDVEVPRMVFGRACLIGDAAFACRPHAAAGTAKAAADAWALAAALGANSKDIDAALAAWEPEQLRLGRRLGARTREIGERSQFKASWVPGDPSLRYGLWEPGN